MMYNILDKKGENRWHFNADEYINVIVEQIAGNFSELENAVQICPDLKKAIEEYRDLQSRGEDDFFALREASTKVKIYC